MVSCIVVDIDTLVKQAKSLLEDGKFEEALSFFDQALLLDQNNADLWNYKGVTLRSMGRYDDALDCFNRSLEIDPRDKDAS